MTGHTPPSRSSGSDSVPPHARWKRLGALIWRNKPGVIASLALAFSIYTFATERKSTSAAATENEAQALQKIVADITHSDDGASGFPSDRSLTDAITGLDLARKLKLGASAVEDYVLGETFRRGEDYELAIVAYRLATHGRLRHDGRGTGKAQDRHYVAYAYRSAAAIRYMLAASLPDSGRAERMQTIAHVDVMKSKEAYARDKYTLPFIVDRSRTFSDLGDVLDQYASGIVRCDWAHRELVEARQTIANDPALTQVFNGPNRHGPSQREAETDYARLPCPKPVGGRVANDVVPVPPFKRPRSG